MGRTLWLTIMNIATGYRAFCNPLDAKVEFKRDVEEIKGKQEEE